MLNRLDNELDRKRIDDSLRKLQTHNFKTKMQQIKEDDEKLELNNHTYKGKI